MAETVRIAVVGGGRTGTPLIEDFLNRPFIELVGVADVDPKSPGAVYAQEHGVYFTTDYTEFAALDADVDVIVEVSGDPNVKRALKDAFVEHNNRSTIIVHDLIARLITSLVGDSDTLLETVHPQDHGIG